MAIPKQLADIGRQIAYLAPAEQSPAAVVLECRRLDEWLDGQGFPGDAPGALAAGLRRKGLDLMAEAQRSLVVWRWFHAWGDILDTRRRLTDPALGFMADHLREQLDGLSAEIAARRAQLERWGIGTADAIAQARAMELPRAKGNYLPVEEVERIAAAIASGEGRSEHA